MVCKNHFGFGFEMGGQALPLKETNLRANCIALMSDIGPAPTTATDSQRRPMVGHLLASRHKGSHEEDRSRTVRRWVSGHLVSPRPGSLSPRRRHLVPRDSPY